MIPPPTTATSATVISSTPGLPHAVPQDADPLDLELDDVAVLQPPAVTVFEDATGSNRAGAEDVAREQPCVACGVRDDGRPRVVHVGELAARALLAVHTRD